MGDVISLRNARKDAARKRETNRAAENRLIHGRSKAETARVEAQAAKARARLDLHRIDTGDAG